MTRKSLDSEQPRPRFDSHEDCQPLDATVIRILRTTSDSARAESRGPTGWVMPLNPFRVRALARWLVSEGYEEQDARERLHKSIAELMAEGAELDDCPILARARGYSQARPATCPPALSRLPRMRRRA